MKIPSLRVPCFCALYLVLMFFGTSCKKTNTTILVVIPTISTTPLIENVTTVSAQSGGTITNGGGGDLTDYGICYSTSNKTPTTGDTKIASQVTNDGTSITNFTCTIKGLTPSTTYYI